MNPFWVFFHQFFFLFFYLLCFTLYSIHALNLLVPVISVSITFIVISVDDGLLILAVNVTDPVLSLTLRDTSVNVTKATEIFYDEVKLHTCGRVTILV